MAVSAQPVRLEGDGAPDAFANKGSVYERLDEGFWYVNVGGNRWAFANTGVEFRLLTPLKVTRV